MLAGKLAGYCSRLFNTNCWAEQTASIAQGDEFDEFLVGPSERSLEDEVNKLLVTDEATRADMAVALEKLRQEISERRRAEDALRQSERRFRSLVENVPYGLFMAEIPSGRFLFLNQQLCDLFGFSLSQGLERTIFEIVDPADHGAINRRLLQRQAAANAEHNAHVFSGIRQDGSTLRFEATVSPVEYQGRQVIQGILRDIGEQERLERQLRQASKMEAIGTLAGGVAHDFNNVLATIVGYAELAMSATERGDTCSEELSHLIRATGRAGDLVRQILTFSRKVDTRLRPLNLNEEVLRTVSILGRTLPKMIEIETSLASDLPAINADATQMEQVLLNLGANAADAIPAGGRLTFTTGRVTVGDEDHRRHPGLRPGDYALVKVSDNGIGMDQSTRQKIFDPFFTTKEPGKGTGLGLSTVFGILKVHQGHIHCTSQPGVGTTFKIFLPAYLAQGAADHDAGAGLTDAPGGDETILLVDDETELRELGRKVLSDAGYQVITASSGEEALEQYRRQPERVDLVILDLSMPGMGGNQCLQELLAFNPQARVVVASGYSAQGPGRDSLKAGAAAFIAKPFRRNDLLSTLRQVLDH